MTRALINSQDNAQNSMHLIIGRANRNILLITSRTYRLSTHKHRCQHHVRKKYTMSYTGYNISFCALEIILPADLLFRLSLCLFWFGYFWNTFFNRRIPHGQQGRPHNARQQDYIELMPYWNKIKIDQLHWNPKCLQDMKRRCTHALVRGDERTTTTNKKSTQRYTICS